MDRSIPDRAHCPLCGDYVHVRWADDSGEATFDGTRYECLGCLIEWRADRLDRLNS